MNGKLQGLEMGAIRERDVRVRVRVRLPPVRGQVTLDWASGRLTARS